MKKITFYTFVTIMIVGCICVILFGAFAVNSNDFKSPFFGYCYISYGFTMFGGIMAQISLRVLRPFGNA